MRRWTAALSALALIAAACVGPSAAPEEPTSYTVGLAEPLALDPQLVMTVEGTQVARLLFRGLTVLTPEGGIAPGLAERWEANKDNTEWIFYLRPDLRFSDGSPLTAADFVYSWSRLADPDLASPLSYQGTLAGIEGWDEVASEEPSGSVGDRPLPGVEAVDDRTLRVRLTDPNSLLPKVAANVAFAPVPRQAVEADPEAFVELPVGQGPYRLADPWRRGEGLTLERNPHYYGFEGKADRIEIVFYVDLATAFRDLQAGTVDLVQLGPGEAEQARETSGDRFVERLVGSLFYLGIPNQVAPYDRAELRRALSLAVDREALVARILPGRVPAAGFVPPVAPGAVVDACPYCRFDPDEAARLYAASGGLDDDRITLVAPAVDTGIEIIEAIGNQYRENLGLEVVFELVEPNLYISTITGDEPLAGPFIQGWGWDYPSAYNFLAPLYDCESTNNFTRYCNPEVDDLLEGFLLAVSEEAGLPVLEEVQRILGDDIPLIPISHGIIQAAHSERIDGVRISIFGRLLLENVEVLP